MPSPLKISSALHLHDTAPFSHPVRVVFCTLAVLISQFLICSQLCTQIGRVDLLLVLPIFLGVRLPIILGTIVAAGFGFVTDVMSGSFIGFHMFYYVSVLVLVLILDQKVDIGGLVYQSLVLGVAWVLEGAVLFVCDFLSREKFYGTEFFSNDFLWRTVVVLVVGTLFLGLMGKISK